MHRCGSARACRRPHLVHNASNAAVGPVLRQTDHLLTREALLIHPHQLGSNVVLGVLELARDAKKCLAHFVRVPTRCLAGASTKLNSCIKRIHFTWKKNLGYLSLVSEANCRVRLSGVAILGDQPLHVVGLAPPL